MAKPATTDRVASAVGRMAAARRHHPDDNERVADAMNDLVAARLERAIEEALHPADPDYEPLRRPDRERLAATLLAD
jgi:hypothetical protein